MYEEYYQEELKIVKEKLKVKKIKLRRAEKRIQATLLFLTKDYKIGFKAYYKERYFILTKDNVHKTFYFDETYLYDENYKSYLNYNIENNINVLKNYFESEV